MFSTRDYVNDLEDSFFKLSVNAWATSTYYKNQYHKYMIGNEWYPAAKWEEQRENPIKRVSNYLPVL